MTISDPVLEKVDATLLKSTASDVEVLDLYKKAKQHGCASVCVFSSFLPTIEAQSSSQHPLLCTVLSFPHGADSVEAKISAAKEMVLAGANEIDYVINLNAALSAEYDVLTVEAEKLRDSISSEVVIKAIIETSEYQTIEQMLAVASAVEEGLSDGDFIKTSTGTTEKGAQVKDVEALREHLRPQTRIKASGGIRNRELALQLIQAGADRIGASNVEGLK